MEGHKELVVCLVFREYRGFREVQELQGRLGLMDNKGHLDRQDHQELQDQMVPQGQMAPQDLMVSPGLKGSQDLAEVWVPLALLVLKDKLVQLVVVEHQDLLVSQDLLDRWDQ